MSLANTDIAMNVDRLDANAMMKHDAAQAAAAAAEPAAVANAGGPATMDTQTQSGGGGGAAAPSYNPSPAYNSYYNYHNPYDSSSSASSLAAASYHSASYHSDASASSASSSSSRTRKGGKPTRNGERKTTQNLKKKHASTGAGAQKKSRNRSGSVGSARSVGSRSSRAVSDADSAADSAIADMEEW